MPASGRAVNPFGTYPLFNKYGAIDLGPVAGGVRLFFNESLSGRHQLGHRGAAVQHQLLRAGGAHRPLAVAAEALFSAEGLRRPRRAGRAGAALGPLDGADHQLLPAPVARPVLVQSGRRDPHRDGARAPTCSCRPTSFRLWSLAVFTGLLAYDWLRVLIWFDHMGLRVATLVNLTFIGGDRLDEAAARFTGHAGRTRVIPDGIRRFATWAPLLIPFYIPHGADWDQAWTGAEQIRSNGTPVRRPPVWDVFAAYRAGRRGLRGRRDR